MTNSRLGVDLTTDLQRKGWREAVQLLPAERFILTIVLASGVLAVLFALALHRSVNWPPFIVGFAASLGLLAVGAYIRGAKAAPRIALAVIAVATFAGFTAGSSVLIYTLLPLPNPMVDDQLARLGHAIGYDWQALVLAMSAWPSVTRALGIVYQSALPQLLLTICVLAAYGRAVALHRFLLVGMLTLVVCVAVWWAWPSVGYVGVLPLSDAEMKAAGLIYPQDYGGYLTRLLMQGPARITPEVITGVVGFPSYHTVMACLVVFYLWRTLLFIPALLFNMAMLVATLVHGGHHLIDVIGGLAVFALGVWLAHRLIRPQP
ncbi:MAG: phosphatase PAP2 family protein [Tabrizicola sp.]